MSSDKIYLTQKGYEEYLNEIDKLKAKLNKNNLSKRTAYEEAPGDGWHDNFVFEDLVREENNILNQIENLLKLGKKITIIEPVNDDDIVDVFDKVELELIYSDGSKEIEVFELNANYYTKHMQEISVNSPLGISIYHKKIGDVVFYQTNNQKVSVRIIRKVK